ncbi:MAG: hypothetical protein GY754_47210 [bacterium]|nr:hypothetical protein [bacterium]
MKKNAIFSSVVSMGLVCLFAFSGCEAGLISDDGMGSGDNSGSGFSFSDMYTRMSALQEEVDWLKQVNEDTLKILSQVAAPVGSIQAWHKNMTGTPNIPTEWVECNGQIINDSESVYNGLAAPNLNSPVYSGNSKGMFLRGYTQSGLFEEDTFELHSHTYTYTEAASGPAMFGGGPRRANVGTAATPKPTTEAGSDETRPSNMSVVWIMRIK